MKKLFVSMLLILLALTCCAFIACKSGESNGTTADPTASDPEPDLGSDPEADPGSDPEADPGSDPGSELPEEPEKPEPVKITIDGVSITEYKIVYPDDTAEAAEYSKAEAVVKAAEAEVKAAADAAAKAEAEAKLAEANAALEAARDAWAKRIFAKQSAEFLAAEILNASEEVVSVVCETEAAGEYEIVIGETGRGEAPACPEYYSYKVTVVDKKIFINGYDNYAIDNAAYALANVLKADTRVNTLSELSLEYTLPAYTEYLENPELLYMRWIKDWQPDPRMRDYDLKIEAFTHVTDRLLTCAHRADGFYYPENSLEGIISFYMMGGDVVELDLQATKDGILILMHDNNLKRMTNANEFLGKTIDGITFPKSYNVSAWTYEQIQYLNLRENKSTETNNGKYTPVTPFKVPTLVEALKFCKGRLLIVPDKTDKWRYVEIDNRSNTPEIYLFDAMKEADNYESILLSYGLTVEDGVDIQKYIYEKTGVMPYLLIRDNNNPEVTYKYLNKGSGAMKLESGKSFGIQINGHFSVTDYPKKYGVYYEALKDKVLIWAWTINNDTDNSTVWDQMYALGHRMIMVNAYLDIVKYASTTFSFD